MQVLITKKYDHISYSLIFVGLVFRNDKNVINLRLWNNPGKCVQPSTQLSKRHQHWAQLDQFRGRPNQSEIILLPLLKF